MRLPLFTPQPKYIPADNEYLVRPVGTPRDVRHGWKHIRKWGKRYTEREREFWLRRWRREGLEIG